MSALCLAWAFADKIKAAAVENLTLVGSALLEPWGKMSRRRQSEKCRDFCGLEGQHNGSYLGAQKSRRVPPALGAPARTHLQSGSASEPALPLGASCLP